jgi:uncharacterized protein YdhG (YjbR/CyaY superfamily)
MPSIIGDALGGAQGSGLQLFWRDNMPRYSSVDDYIKDQPEGTRGALTELKDCILTAVPEAEELFNYNIPAFALIEYGKREQQIMIAGYKNHVGLYPHPTTIEQFAERLKEYKQGKGSIQFPTNKPIPKELVIEMVRFRKKLIMEGK